MTDTADCLQVVTNHEYQHVIDRIRLSFPDMDPRQIRQIVDAAVRELAGARLKQFVPLLVERTARDECRHRWNDRAVVQLPTQ